VLRFERETRGRLRPDLPLGVRPIDLRQRLPDQPSAPPWPRTQRAPHGVGGPPRIRAHRPSFARPGRERCVEQTHPRAWGGPTTNAPCVLALVAHGSSFPVPVPPPPSLAGFHLCTRNVHRVLLATTLVSAKLLDDECYNNMYWASVGGVSLTHLNQLEVDVMSLLDYSLLVTAPELEAARLRLLSSEAPPRCSQHCK
jgi:hypothetical protein